MRLDPLSQAPDADAAHRVAAVRARITAAALAAGRDPADVTLVAVGKTRGAEALRAVADAGVMDFGENYLQEALGKQVLLGGAALRWHFIGAIQSNKTRALAEHFDWVHTVDREKIARRLAAHRPDDRPPLNLCLQVNIDREPTKAGLDPDALADVFAAIRDLPGLRIRGLMAIPAPRREPAAQRDAFARVAALRDALAEAWPDSPLDVLSMGMSDDLEAAIAAGATHVRIGTALFGPRATREHTQ
ncbi:MAG: YggS family pyridoxal phosphate-dependent enzyme [Pseudomonadales bacterium]|jgi:pyridoxal phosphate enzyme (YggS family)|nr:YggS family pyridoxal phosphate-dependent enzyme [Pseudomonadales bacterium]